MKIFYMSLMALLTLSLMTTHAATPDERADAPMMVADSSRVYDLDEVVVVSSPKESFLLRHQPLSSTVFTSKEMSVLNARELRQLSAYVPSFAAPAYGSRLTSSMYIRGLGSRISNSAIGVYYDNIPLMSPATFNHHYYAIDRVDVLRGPQGTLYGANTEGGIVRVYSKNPMNYQGTDVSLGLATGWGRQMEVSHSSKLSDKVALGVAAFYSGQRGFFKNESVDDYSDAGNELGTKFHLAWKPTNRLSVDLTADYQYSDQNAFPYGSYDVAEEWPALPQTNLMSGYRRHMFNSGLTIGYDTQRLLLTSTTSYQHLDDRMSMDIDYSPRDMMSLLQKQHMHAVTEELTLRSKGTGFWRHATGVFASREWLDTDATVTFGQAILRPISLAIENAMKNAMLQAFTGRFIAAGMPPQVAAAQAQAQVDAMGVTMSAEMAVPNAFKQPETNFGAYHESNITLFNRLTATLGLRYDYTKAQIDYDSYGYMAMTGGTRNAVTTNTLSSHLVNSHNSSFHQLLPKAGLTYQFHNNGSNVYATVSKGYMAGGFNIQLFSDIQQADLRNPAAQQQAQRGDVEIEHTAQDYADIEEAISYKPEESWNYEFGVHLNLFGQRAHADISTFYTQLRNQQLAVFAPNFGFGRMTVNAGKSSSCGLELALRGQAAENHLTWAATYSFTRATFRDYQDTDGQGNIVDYKDNYVPYVPQHMFSALADYRIDLKANSLFKAVTIGVNTNGNGKVYWDDANTASRGFYALLGAHVRLDCGAVSVNFWGSNLLDAQYTPFAAYSGGWIGQRGTPRQLGFDVNIHI